MRVFFDTSSFVKRFVEEVGSEEADNTCQNATELGLSIICFPEIISALSRKLREKNITKEDYLELKFEVTKDIEDADIINITPTILEKVIHLLENNTLRSLDAIHIASALEWEAGLFVSSDERQVLAAKNAGLNVKYIQGVRL